MTAQTSVTKPFDPVAIASSAGAASSSWHKLGEGMWSGTVVSKKGAAIAVEQLKTGWKVTDETGRSTSGKQLPALLTKALS